MNDAQGSSPSNGLTLLRMLLGLLWNCPRSWGAAPKPIWAACCTGSTMDLISVQRWRCECPGKDLTSRSELLYSAILKGLEVSTAASKLAII